MKDSNIVETMSLVPKMSVYLILLLSIFIGEGNFQNLSYIENELVRKTVREYIEWCPYTDLCFLPAQRAFPTVPSNSTSITVTVPCCKSCSCKDQCDTSCCPDKPGSYLTYDEVLEIKQDVTSCQRMQYKKVDEENSLLKNTAIFTVSDCPSDYGDIDIKTKCVKNYYDYDFEDVVSNFVPVSKSSALFKNRYCAICNGVDLQGVEFWNIGISCTPGSKYRPFNSLLELKNVIDTNEDCDLFFSPVTSLILILRQRCTPVIDRCNVSGHWLQYDADIERACLSYKSVYKAYKNVHCYICNKKPEDGIPKECAPGKFNPGYNPNAFVTLLDFRGLQKYHSKTPPVRSVKCQTGYEYDNIQDECRLLLCPEFMYLGDGQCIYLMQTIFVYDVIITMEPRDAIKTYQVLPGSMAVLYNALWHHVSTLLKERQSTYSMCQLFGVMFLRKGFNEIVIDFKKDQRKNLEYSEIEYFAFRLQLRGYGGMNLSQDSQTFDIMFQNYSSVPYLSQYIIRYQNIPVELFDTALKTYNEYLVNGNFTRNMILYTLMIESQLLKSLAASFNYSSSLNNITLIAPMYEYTADACYSVAKYQVQPSCPKIELFADEYSVTDDGVVITDLKLSLPNHQVIFTQNDTVLVCYTTYMSSSKNETSHHQNDGASGMDPMMILTVICISISLISLTITFTIYALFKQLRTLPGLNIMSLVFSLFITHFLTLINGVVRINVSELCTVFGILLHLSLLFSISWMFVCTFHMARVFVHLERMKHKDNNPLHSFTRYGVFTTSVSVLLVVTNIVVSYVRSANASIGYDDRVCYLDSSDMLLFTVAIPIGIVVIANIIMFIGVIIKVLRVPTLKAQRRKERNNIIIFAKLSTITGITWGFGFLYQFTNIEAFAYVFVVLNASQGVFIMAAFVVNRRVVDMLRSRYQDLINSSTDQSVLQSSERSTTSTYNTESNNTLTQL